MATDPITIVLIYDESTDNFYPLEDGKKPDPESNTYLVIDEVAKKITLSFTPSSTLIEKRTIERRVNSFIKTGYNVPGKKGLRIGAKLPLTKVDPKSGELPEVLLTHGHTFGKGKLIRDSVPDYVEKEDNYEIEDGSAGTKTDVTGKFVPKQEGKPASKPMPKTEEKPSEAKKMPEWETKLDTVPLPEKTPVNKDDGLLIAPEDEHLFILGQFVDMLMKDGEFVVVSKKDGKVELKTLKADESYFIQGTELFNK